MTQYKFSIYYLEEYMLHCVKCNRTIKIILAITSAASIAAWTKWQNLDFIWGLIIALSQVLSVINDILPYKKRILEISNLQAELSTIYYDVEKNWLKVANGKLTEKEINTMCYKFVNKWNETNNKYFKNDSLPQKSKYIKEAEIKKDRYFENNF